VFNRKCDQYWAEAEYLPIKAVLDYWCGNNPECREAKKFAIIAACERGEVEYARTDGKDFSDPVLDLIGRRILVIHRESFEKWAKKIDQNNKPDLPIDIRSETTFLNIIGAMLETFIHKAHGNIEFSSETKLREFLSKKYSGFKGVTERTLAEKFATAKKAIREEFD